MWPRATSSVTKVTIFIWTMQTSGQRNHNLRQTWWKETGLGLKQLPVSCAGSWEEGCLGHVRIFSIWVPGSLWNSNVLHLSEVFLPHWDIVSCSQTTLHSSLELGRQYDFLNSRQSFQQSFPLWIGCPVESSYDFWNVLHHMHGFLSSNKNRLHAESIPISFVILRQGLTV